MESPRSGGGIGRLAVARQHRTTWAPLVRRGVQGQGGNIIGRFLRSGFAVRQLTIVLLVSAGLTHPASLEKRGKVGTGKSCDKSQKRPENSWPPDSRGGCPYMAVCRFRRKS